MCYSETAKRHKKKYVSDWQQLRMIVNDLRYSVTEIHLGVGEDSAAFVCYDTKEEDCPETPFHNPLLAAHVTAYGCLTLLNFLHQVEGRALYW